MTSNNTRREFLQSVGATGIATIPIRADDETVTSLDAVDLLIPASEVPTGFKQQPTPDSNSFIDALYAADPGTTSADIAVQGYWKGGEQTDPEWVLSSLAIVADDSIPRETLVMQHLSRSGGMQGPAPVNFVLSGSVMSRTTNTGIRSLCRERWGSGQFPLFRVFRFSNDGSLPIRVMILRHRSGAN